MNDVPDKAKFFWATVFTHIGRGIKTTVFVGGLIRTGHEMSACNLTYEMSVTSAHIAHEDIEAETGRVRDLPTAAQLIVSN